MLDPALNDSMCRRQMFRKQHNPTHHNEKDATDTMNRSTPRQQGQHTHSVVYMYCSPLERGAITRGAIQLVSLLLQESKRDIDLAHLPQPILFRSP